MGKKKKEKKEEEKRNVPQPEYQVDGRWSRGRGPLSHSCECHWVMNSEWTTRKLENSSGYWITALLRSLRCLTPTAYGGVARCDGNHFLPLFIILESHLFIFSFCHALYGLKVSPQVPPSPGLNELEFLPPNAGFSPANHSAELRDSFLNTTNHNISVEITRNQDPLSWEVNTKQHSKEFQWGWYRK